MLQPQVATCGYENKSFQDKLQNRLEKSDFHNRMVIDLRKKASKKSNCL
jgi:anti-anti-sigma regulatory factor